MRSTKNKLNLIFNLFLFSLCFGGLYLYVGFALKPYMIVAFFMVIIILLFRIKSIAKLFSFEKNLLIFSFISCLTIIQFRYDSSVLRFILGFILVLSVYFVIRTIIIFLDKKCIEKIIFNVGFIFGLITLIYYVYGLFKIGFNFYGNGIQFYGLLMDRGIPRLISFASDDPNITAMLMTIFLMFYFFKINIALKYKFCFLLYLLLIVLTFSRGAFISLIFTFSFIAISKYKSNFKSIFNFMFLILLASFIIPITINHFFEIDIYKIILVRFFESSFDEGSGRLTLWLNAIETFKKFPLFGIGINSSLNYNLINYGTFNYVHNTYLEVLSETGIIGFYFYFLFLFGLIKSSFFIYKQKKENGYLLFVLISLLFQMFFLSVLLSEFFFLVVVLIFKYYYDAFEARSINLEGYNND
jgi:O-antigen ligase